MGNAEDEAPEPDLRIPPADEESVWITTTKDGPSFLVRMHPDEVDAFIEQVSVEGYRSEGLWFPPDRIESIVRIGAI